jgi:cytidine deaminase
MEKKDYHFNFTSYASERELPDADRILVTKARKATSLAYAPYSNFRVAAVAQLSNGEAVTGTNQENASYPVGICAERVLLSAVSSLYPNISIETIAISYDNINGESNRPISPCGICRQSLLEYEERSGQSIRLILSGKEGEVVVVEKAAQLLPLSFGGEDLK